MQTKHEWEGDKRDGVPEDVIHPVKGNVRSLCSCVYAASRNKHQPLIPPGDFYSINSLCTKPSLQGSSSAVTFSSLQLPPFLRTLPAGAASLWLTSHCSRSNVTCTRWSRPRSATNGSQDSYFPALRDDPSWAGEWLDGVPEADSQTEEAGGSSLVF